ncbi:MAG: NlpC/P60 family protein [Clostridium sp.]|nr:NlpC/P60 family protein [Clostridium sp.]
MKHKILMVLLTLFLTAGLFVKVEVVEAAGAVKLNKQKIVLEMEDSYQLKVKNTTKKIKWSSSDKKVVKVNSKGTLTPTGVGAATVTAKVGSKKYKCKVTVADYNGMSEEQKAVVSYALQYVGNRYVYGGSSLTKGTDCSGFTMAVYKKFGYSLPHNAYSQLTKKSVKKVSMKKIKPGDLIFYGASKKSCSHVALYIGNEKVVHASTESTGITISDYTYRKYVGVGRVLKKETYPSSEDESTTRFAVSK